MSFEKEFEYHKIPEYYDRYFNYAHFHSSIRELVSRMKQEELRLQEAFARNQGQPTLFKPTDKYTKFDENLVKQTLDLSKMETFDSENNPRFGFDFAGKTDDEDFDQIL